MSKSTRDEHYISIMKQALRTSPAGILELFSALNIFLSITASFGNVLILIALRNVSSIHPPTKHFYRCLAITDLCVGVIVQPLFATYIINMIPAVEINLSVFRYVFKVMGASSVILCGLSVAISTAISVDRPTSRLVAWTEIQTYCNIKASSCCFNLLLVAFFFGWIGTELE